MNTNKSSVWVMALGLSLVVSANYALVTAVLWPEALYALPVVFISVFGVVLAGPLPMETILGTRERIYEHRADVEHLRAVAAQHRQRAQEATQTPPSGPVVENPPQDALQARQRALRAFYALVFANARAVGTLGWRKGFEGVMDNVADWRLWVKEPLIRAEMAVAINYGANQSATWKEGWGPDKAEGWLLSNLPPVPEGAIPNMREASIPHTEYSGKQEPAGETA